MPGRKNKGIVIWQYFDNKIEIGKAVCRLCKVSLKNNKNFNLKVHLLKKHNIHFNDRVNYNSSSSSGIASLVSERKQNIKVQINRRVLFRSYIGLVIENNVPFHVLDCSNFKNIIEPICISLNEELEKPIALSSTNCKIVLKTVSENIRKKIQVEMKNKLISLKIDSADRLSENIFGISAQFIEEDEIKSLILGMVELKEADTHVSNNLAEEIMRTLNTYDVELNQVISVTCDNAVDMTKTPKIISSYNVNEDREEEGNVTYLNNINKLEQPSTLRVAHIQVRRCAAHIAQLVALDAVKDSEIKAFLLSCRNFTKFIRNTSYGFQYAFDVKNFSIVAQLDCSTKWGSTFKMIDTLLNAKDYLLSVESVVNKSIDENFENSELLWEFMECYATVFRPLQVTIAKFQDEQLHYGNFFAQWLKCKLLTQKIVEENITRPLIQKIGSKLLESIEKRTTKLLENESLNACLFLDPRFHHTLSPASRQDAIIYLHHIWGKLCLLSDEYESGSDASMPVHTGLQDEEDEMLDSFLMQTLKPESDENDYADVYSKIKNLHLPFMRSNTDVLQFWKDRKLSEPELYALSNVCFGIPSTQVTKEGVLSSLELILANNRNRLNRETLENILMVKLNPKFLDEAINSLPLFEVCL